MEKFGAKLRRLRQAKGYGVRELEDLAAIPHGIVSRLERNERAYPSMAVGMKLAKQLGVTLDYLSGMYEEAPPQEGKPL